MKVVFAGPSLYGLDLDLTGLEMRPPARKGDVLAAVEQGATTIGLIDGYFGFTASVWHKEILFALAQGVAVYGAASMGALRAAECAAYGMIPVGAIAEAYCSGEIEDDDAVAVVHGPDVLGYAPLSQPLVDIEATIKAVAAARLITADEQRLLVATARRLHFAQRTFDTIVTEAHFGTRRSRVMRHLLADNYVDQKRCDAQLLIAVLRDTQPGEPHRPQWQLNVSKDWERFLSQRAAP